MKAGQQALVAQLAGTAHVLERDEALLLDAVDWFVLGDVLNYHGCKQTHFELELGLFVKSKFCASCEQTLKIAGKGSWPRILARTK